MAVARTVASSHGPLGRLLIGFHGIDCLVPFGVELGPGLGRNALDPVLGERGQHLLSDELKPVCDVGVLMGTLQRALHGVERRQQVARQTQMYGLSHTLPFTSQTFDALVVLGRQCSKLVSRAVFERLDALSVTLALTHDRAHGAEEQQAEHRDDEEYVDIHTKRREKRGRKMTASIVQPFPVDRTRCAGRVRGARYAPGGHN